MIASPWQPKATFSGVIDISHNNGVIDWSLVPDTILLVFIKATQGSHFTDPRFVENRTGAEERGKLVVPYHFLDASPVSSQAAHFFEITGAGSGDPVMIDWEPVPPSLALPPISTMQNFGAMAHAKTGRAPLAYHGMYQLSNAAINALPWFLPKYGPEPRGPKWLFWQDRPNLQVAGIPNPTDHSIFAGTEDELLAWHNTGAMPSSFT